MHYFVSCEPKLFNQEQFNRVSNFVVPEVGLEPTHLSMEDFESSASTISPLGHFDLFVNSCKHYKTRCMSCQTFYFVWCVWRDSNSQSSGR